jgi:hypothetical protein
MDFVARTAFPVPPDAPRQLVNLTSCSWFPSLPTPLFRVARHGASLPERRDGRSPMAVFPGDVAPNVGPFLLSDKRDGKTAKRRTLISARWRYRACSEAQSSCVYATRSSGASDFIATYR